MVDFYSYDRVLAAAMREVDDRIPAMVERAFEGLPLDVKELPIIGGWPFLNCERAVQKQTAIAAVRAVRWFEFEAPKWAQPLLLKAEECYPLLNNHPNGRNYRALLRGTYSMHARTMDWVIKHMTPFEVFCAHTLSPPA